MRSKTPTNFEMVWEFHEKFDACRNNVPTFIDEETEQLRVGLIEEEVSELKEAIKSRDIVGIADALTDILYVVYGSGVSFGIDLDRTFKEVHRSNMSKLTSDGKILRREDGKILKSDQYSPPNLKVILVDQVLRLKSDDIKG